MSVGVGGAWIGSLTALATYRWIFVTLAMGAVGYAGYSEWQLSRQPDCDCETAFNSTTRRSLLGIGALAVVTLVVSPWLFGLSPSGATQQAQAAATGSQDASGGSATPESFQQVVLKVEGMTCAACPKTVRTSLEGVEGVHSAEATFKPPEAVVRFDPAMVTVEELTRATPKSGSTATVGSNSTSGAQKSVQASSFWARAVDRGRMSVTPRMRVSVNPTARNENIGQ